MVVFSAVDIPSSEDVFKVTCGMDPRQCKIEYTIDGVAKTRYFVDCVEFTAADITGV